MKWFFVSFKPIRVSDLGYKMHFWSGWTKSRDTARFKLICAVGEYAYNFSMYSPITHTFFPALSLTTLKFFLSIRRKVYLGLRQKQIFCVLAYYARTCLADSPSTRKYFFRAPLKHLYSFCVISVYAKVLKNRIILFSSSLLTCLRPQSHTFTSEASKSLVIVPQ